MLLAHREMSGRLLEELIKLVHVVYVVSCALVYFKCLLCAVCKYRHMIKQVNGRLSMWVLIQKCGNAESTIYRVQTYVLHAGIRLEHPGCNHN